METYTTMDELQVIYRDVLKTGEELGVRMLYYLSLKSCMTVRLCFANKRGLSRC